MESGLYHIVAPPDPEPIDVVANEWSPTSRPRVSEGSGKGLPLHYITCSATWHTESHPIPYQPNLSRFLICPRLFSVVLIIFLSSFPLLHPRLGLPEWFFWHPPCPPTTHGPRLLPFAAICYEVLALKAINSLRFRTPPP